MPYSLCLGQPAPGALILNRSFPENLIFRAGIHCRSWSADSKPMSAAPLSRGWAQDKSTLALTQPMAREKVLIGFQKYAEVGPRNPPNTAGLRLPESECLDHQSADTIPVDESQCRKCLKQIESQAFYPLNSPGSPTSTLPEPQPPIHRRKGPSKS